MANLKDGGPAFPRPASEDRSSGSLHDGDSVVEQQDGMSMRAYFAAKALPEAMRYAYETGGAPPKVIALAAVQQADALLDELEKPRG